MKRQNSYANSSSKREFLSSSEEEVPSEYSSNSGFLRSFGEEFSSEYSSNSGFLRSSGEEISSTRLNKRKFFQNLDEEVESEYPESDSYNEFSVNRPSKRLKQSNTFIDYERIEHNYVSSVIEKIKTITDSDGLDRQDTVKELIYEISRSVNKLIEFSKELPSKNDQEFLSGLLERIDKEAFGSLLRHHEEFNKSCLVNLFYNMALLKSAQGDLTGGLKYYTDSAVFCQYVISIFDDVDDLFTKKPLIRYWKEWSYDLLTKNYNKLVDLCSLKKSPPSDIEINEDSVASFSGQDSLEKLRAGSPKKLRLIKESLKTSSKKYVEDTEVFFREISSEMKEYLAYLFAEAEKVIGKAPCPYAVMGLGSIALSQSTPYSDLEFAILTANVDYRCENDDSKIKDYFRNISHIVHFKNICLGETIIPTSAYGVKLEKYVKRAVNFDLGGKTTLGRPDKPYELIKTVEGMLLYIKSVHKEDAYHIDKHLSSVLERVCFVYGDEALVKQYKKDLNNFMSSSFKSSDPESGQSNLSNSQHGSFRRLKKGIIEKDHDTHTKASTHTQGASIKKTSSGHFEQFQPNLGYCSAGKSFDVKQEIYRMPDRFINHLGKLLNVQEQTGWSILKKLREEGVISEAGEMNLKKSLCFAASLRVKIYNHYGRQKEKMLYFPEEIQNELLGFCEAFQLENEELGVESPLFEFYYSMVALYQKLIQVCDHIELYKTVPENAFSQESFRDDSLYNKVNICVRLMQWQKALDFCKEFLQSEKDQSFSNVKFVKIKSTMGLILNNLGKYEEALRCQEELSGIIENFKNEPLLIATCFVNIAYTYNKLEKYENALGHQKCALSIIQEGYEDGKIPDPSAFKASCLNNIGYTYIKLNQYDEALTSFIEALELYENLDHKDYLSIAIRLSNIGYAYNKVGSIDEALECHKRAFTVIKEKILHDHPSLSTLISRESSHSCAEMERINLALIDKIKEAEKYQELIGEKDLRIIAGLDHISSTYTGASYPEAFKRAGGFASDNMAALSMSASVLNRDFLIRKKENIPSNEPTEFANPTNPLSDSIGLINGIVDNSTVLNISKAIVGNLSNALSSALQFLEKTHEVSNGIFSIGKSLFNNLSKLYNLIQNVNEVREFSNQDGFSNLDLREVVDLSKEVVKLCETINLSGQVDMPVNNNENISYDPHVGPSLF